MNNKLPSHSAQTGVSLVIALLLLLVLTVLGVASMSGSLMQERMAGNVNLQTLAFEAASAGVSGSAEFGLNKDNWPADAACARGTGDWDPLPDWSGWSDPLFDDGTLPPGVVVEYRRRVGCFEPDKIPDEWAEAATKGFSFPTQLLVLNQGRVRRGENVLGEDVLAKDVLAMREIEVRVENRAGNQACAVRIERGLGPGQIDIQGGGPEVDGGEGGCSVGISPLDPSDPSGPGGVGDLIAEIGPNHIGNYTPPPEENNGHLPWNDPEVFADLMNQMKTAVLAYRDFVSADTPSTQPEWRCDLGARLGGDLASVDESALPAWVELPESLDGCDPSVNRSEDVTEPGESELLATILSFVEQRDSGWDIESCKSTFYDGNARIGNGGIPGGQCQIENGSVPTWRHTNVDVGDPGNPETITYIAGHMGNPSNNTGSGLVIMEGGNCWSGTADFQGLQLILGGHYEIIGGGGGETDGSIVLSKLENRYGESDFDNDFNSRTPSELEGWLYPNILADPDFDPSGLSFNGGGNHKISFACGEEGDPDNVGLATYIGLINQCLETDLEPNCGPDGDRRKAIASWREYVDRDRWPQE